MPKKMLQVLAGKSHPQPPIWLMRQAGRYLPEYRKLRKAQKNLLSFFLSPQHASKATLQPLRRYDLDAAIVFSDILILPYALGRDLVYHDNTGPAMTPLTLADVAKLPENPPAAIVETAAETIARTLGELPANTTMIGFAGSPFAVACYMIDGGSIPDFPQCRHWLEYHPAEFLALLDNLTEHTISLLQSQIDAGAEVVQIFDSWASIAPASHFDEVIITPTRKICDALKKSHPHAYVIGFPRLAGCHTEHYITKSGVHGVSLDHTTSPSLLRTKLSPAFRSIPLQGNINPTDLLAGGKILERACSKLAVEVKDTPHIFNLGHGVLKNTSPHHVEQMITFLKS